MIMDDYRSWVVGKRTATIPAGFAVKLSDPFLFPFQAATVGWACGMGRAAIFADTGLGKTRMQLAWAREVARETGGRVLIVTPLAVGKQTEREAAKCGIPGVVFCRDPSETTAPICITNYDSLSRWEGFDAAGVVLDESSILKAFMGRTRNELIARFATTPYRLACTATPSPNDYTELGNHAEFLGVSSRTEMLARYFVNDLGEVGADKWRIKGHAVVPFWDWVCSWARMIGVPSDIGDYSDDGYNLPPLTIHKHMVDTDLAEDRGDGMLFRLAGASATGLHAEKRRTADDRAAMVARVIAFEPSEPWLIWCDTNYEAEALRAVLPEAVEVEGSQTPEVKAARLLGFADGDFRVLLTKPKIAGFGMNWQHCRRQAFVGVGYSYEAFYQSVRRSWRFGQDQEVHAHVFMAWTEAPVWASVEAKADSHDEMKVQMFAASRRAAARSVAMADYHPTHIATLPGWLRSPK